MQLIAERLGEVRAGVIRLNREGDKERFEKLRIGTYVLDDHALVGLLTMLDEGDEEAAS
jgi:DNA-binding transcriptional regulator PaaX